MHINWRLLSVRTFIFFDKIEFIIFIFPIDKSKSASPGSEEGNSPRGVFGGPDVWRKYRIDPIKVNEWTANLRMASKMRSDILRKFHYTHMYMYVCACVCVCV